MCTPLTQWIFPGPGPRYIFIPTLYCTLTWAQIGSTDRPIMYPRYGKNTTPSPPLLCTNSVSSCTTVSGGSSDTCKAVDVKEERWSRSFAFWLIDEVQPYQRRSPSALDFRFPPLLFRANQGPWNCALWLYSFSFESWRPDTRIGDNNNCSTSKWLCNTSHLRIIRIRILEKWAKYEHHPSFKAGHSFFFCYFARFFLPLELFHKILYPSCCLRLYLYTRPKFTQNIWDRAEEKVLECH